MIEYGGTIVDAFQHHKKRKKWKVIRHNVIETYKKMRKDFF